MASICWLYIPHKFRFAGGVIAWAVHDTYCTCGGAHRAPRRSEFEWYLRTATNDKWRGARALGGTGTSGAKLQASNIQAPEKFQDPSSKAVAHGAHGGLSA